MAEPILDGPRIVAGVRQRVAAGVAEHVDVDGEVKAGALTDALYKPIDGVGGERRSPLGLENIAASRLAL